jgi:hypothetical protein
MEERKTQLKTQIQELLNWKRQFELSQVSDPLGSTSKNILSKDLLVHTGVFAGSLTPNLWIEVSIDGVLWWLSVQTQ